jgi:hypothetical protein
VKQETARTEKEFDLCFSTLTKRILLVISRILVIEVSKRLTTRIGYKVYSQPLFLDKISQTS